MSNITSYTFGASAGDVNIGTLIVQHVATFPSASLPSQEREASVIDLTVPGNRLFQELNGNLTLAPKTPAYVFGERVLRPFIDATYEFGSSLVQNTRWLFHSLIGNSTKYIDRSMKYFPSLPTFLPGASAQTVTREMNLEQSESICYLPSQTTQGFESDIEHAETLAKQNQLQESVRFYYALSQEAYHSKRLDRVALCAERIQKIDPSYSHFSGNQKQTLLTQHYVTELFQQFQSSQKKLLQLEETVLKANRKVVELERRIQENLLRGAFRKADWEKFFGDVGIEPPLPPQIEEILKSPCPFWLDRRVEETHLLVLIPQTVDGKPLTLNSLAELIQHPKQGFATQYKNYDSFVKQELGNKASSSSYWILITKNIIPDSQGKDYSDQCQLMANHSQRTALPYKLPRALEVVVSTLIYYVKTGERLYPKEPESFTRCQESVNSNQLPVAVGGFSREGLPIFHYHGNNFGGVAGVRRL